MLFILKINFFLTNDKTNDIRLADCCLKNTNARPGAYSMSIAHGCCNGDYDDNKMRESGDLFGNKGAEMLKIDCVLITNVEWNQTMVGGCISGPIK